MMSKKEVENALVQGSMDFSKVMSRLMAFLSRDKHMLDAHEKGADLHAKTAAEIFQVPEKDVTANQRNMAKALTFYVLYSDKEGELKWG